MFLIFWIYWKVAIVVYSHGAQMKWFYKNPQLFFVSWDLCWWLTNWHFIFFIQFKPTHLKNHMGLFIITCHAYKNKCRTNPLSTQMHSLSLYKSIEIQHIHELYHKLTIRKKVFGKKPNCFKCIYFSSITQSQNHKLVTRNKVFEKNKVSPKCFCFNSNIVSCAQVGHKRKYLGKSQGSQKMPLFEIQHNHYVTS